MMMAISYFEVPYLALQTFAAELKRSRWTHYRILGNPNNPDGTLLDKQSIKVYSTNVKKMLIAYFVIDESFIDFIGDESLRDNSYPCASSLINMTM